ncbi:MAG: sigma-70 family RNA polymerase sigma factor [Thermoguttaceae bacterium]|nr:sigma-70 family RNA polymerase sigma factor [Thermoguttaceae bacterium]
MTERELTEWNDLIKSTARRLASRCRLSVADAYQHTLIAAWKIKIDKRYSKKRQENYLRKILYLRALSELKKDFFREKTESLDAAPALNKTEAYSDFYLDLETQIERAFALNPAKRNFVKTVLTRRFIEGLSTLEIARELKVGQRTVQRVIKIIRDSILSTENE